MFRGGNDEVRWSQRGEGAGGGRENQEEDGRSTAGGRREAMKRGRVIMERR